MLIFQISKSYSIHHGFYNGKCKLLEIAHVTLLLNPSSDLELHIDDVELAYSKRPFDSELSLLISTLTLCDRTQAFGHVAYMMGRSFPLGGSQLCEINHHNPDL